jgi:hypothetical protein
MVGRFRYVQQKQAARLRRHRGLLRKFAARFGVVLTNTGNSASGRTDVFWQRPCCQLCGMAFRPVAAEARIGRTIGTLGTRTLRNKFRHVACFGW